MLILSSSNLDSFFKGKNTFSTLRKIIELDSNHILFSLGSGCFSSLPNPKIENPIKTNFNILLQIAMP